METSIRKKENRFWELPPVKRLFLLIPILLSIVSLHMADKYDKITNETRPCAVLIYTMIVVSILSLYFRTERQRVLPFILFLIAPAASFVLLESMMHNPFVEMKWKVILLNLVFFYAFALLFFFLTKRTWPAILFCAVFASICGIAEHYVLLFRDAPLFPWDLASIGVASTVVENYEFSVTYYLAASFTALMTLIVLGFRLSGKFEISIGLVSKAVCKKAETVTRIVASILLVSVLGGFVYYVNLDRSYTDFGMYPYLFTPKVVYKRNGFTVAFLSMLRYVTIEKPEGYSDSAVGEVKDIGVGGAEEYNENVRLGNVTDEEGVLPNIVVIMNEAFSDLSIYTDFETNKEYMPFLNSLSENTVKGNLHVSVLGGNTANTEFEFLTGCSMAFLPTGSIPYQQYIKDELPALPSQLDSIGYESLAVHPYVTTGWNRNTVYPWMGFDKSIFKVGLKNYTLIRDYVSDISVYRYILNKLMDEDQGEPLFVFNVTMQNHGSYTAKHDNFNHFNVTATGFENDMKLSTYLSLIKKSDEAMEFLLNSLEEFDEPTIVCFFGDHQPAAAVSSKMLKKYGVKINDEKIEELEQRYIVPFYIWANYDIDEAEYENISVNYLSTLLLKTAGLPLTDSQGFLSELYLEYPVITANAFMDKDGVLHPSDEKEGEKLLNQYAMMQYNYLVDGDEYSMFSYDYNRHQVFLYEK